MLLEGTPDYEHGAPAKIGVLLVNLGTPDAPTPSAVRRYLKQFLSDPRVVETPRGLWWFILRLLVLPFRPRRTAAAYREIWTPEGSPLMIISKAQRAALQQALAPLPTVVALGMSYGAPSIADALRELKRENCTHLLALPLYPQYASSTTGSVFSDVVKVLSRWRAVPHFRFISGYCSHPGYVDALATSIARQRAALPETDLLIFSFHGTPLKMLTDGDPYHCLCHKTARLTAEKLGLAEGEWRVTFQSRFGRAEWLQPYTDETLASLPAQGVRRVQIVCPAFAADCLETLEEIAGENREIFIKAGGARYDYLSALNDTPEHIDFLNNLVRDAIADWTPVLQNDNAMRERQRAAYDAMRPSPQA